MKISIPFNVCITVPLNESIKMILALLEIIIIILPSGENFSPVQSPPVPSFSSLNVVKGP